MAALLALACGPGDYEVAEVPAEVRASEDEEGETRQMFQWSRLAWLVCTQEPARVSVGAVPIELSRADLLAYRDRRWDLVRESKESHWAAQTRTGGPSAGFRAGAALWVHARLVDPSWPTNELRHEDYQHHLALAAKFDRVAHVFARC